MTDAIILAEAHRAAVQDLVDRISPIGEFVHFDMTVPKHGYSLKPLTLKDSEEEEIIVKDIRERARKLYGENEYWQDNAELAIRIVLNHLGVHGGRHIKQALLDAALNNGDGS